MIETSHNTRTEIIQKAVEIIRRSNLLNDEFVSVVLGDKLACKHVINTILERGDLTIVESKGQYRLLNPTSKDAILDVFAQDSAGHLINIEIQRRNDIDHARRIRFYTSMIDKSILEQGVDWSQIPDVYIIYISEHDLWEAGQVLYSVSKKLETAGIPYDDGSHVIYANTAVDDGSKVAQMLQYFKTADPYDMSQGDLSKRVHFLKTETRGVELMSEISDCIYSQAKEATELEAIKTLWQDLILPPSRPWIFLVYRLKTNRNTFQCYVKLPSLHILTD